MLWRESPLDCPGLGETEASAGVITPALGEKLFRYSLCKGAEGRKSKCACLWETELSREDEQAWARSCSLLLSDDKGEPPARPSEFQSLTPRVTAAGIRVWKPSPCDLLVWPSGSAGRYLAPTRQDVNMVLVSTFGESLWVMVREKGLKSRGHTWPSL